MSNRYRVQGPDDSVRCGVIDYIDEEEQQKASQGVEQCSGIILIF